MYNEHNLIKSEEILWKALGKKYKAKKDGMKKIHSQ